MNTPARETGKNTLLRSLHLVDQAKLLCLGWARKAAGQSALTPVTRSELLTKHSRLLSVPGFTCGRWLGSKRKQIKQQRRHYRDML